MLNASLIISNISDTSDITATPAKEKAYRSMVWFPHPSVPAAQPLSPFGTAPLEGSLFWEEKDGSDLATDAAKAIGHFLIGETDYAQT